MLKYDVVVANAWNSLNRVLPAGRCQLRIVVDAALIVGCAACVCLAACNTWFAFGSCNLYSSINYHWCPTSGRVDYSGLMPNYWSETQAGFRAYLNACGVRVWSTWAGEHMCQTWRRHPEDCVTDALGVATMNWVNCVRARTHGASMQAFTAQVRPVSGCHTLWPQYILITRSHLRHLTFDCYDWSARCTSRRMSRRWTQDLDGRDKFTIGDFPSSSQPPGRSKTYRGIPKSQCFSWSFMPVSCVQGPQEMGLEAWPCLGSYALWTLSWLAGIRTLKRGVIVPSSWQWRHRNGQGLNRVSKGPINKEAGSGLTMNVG